MWCVYFTNFFVACSTISSSISFCPTEVEAGPVPLPNDKALKDKKKKLKETLDRMVKLVVSLLIYQNNNHYYAVRVALEGQ